MEKLYINEDFYAWNCHWHWQLTGCCLCMCMLLDSQLGFKGTGHWFFSPLDITSNCLLVISNLSNSCEKRSTWAVIEWILFPFERRQILLLLHFEVSFTCFQWLSVWEVITGYRASDWSAVRADELLCSNTFYVQLFCRLLKLVKSQRVGTSNDKSALPFVNLPYLT